MSLEELKGYVQAQSERAVLHTDNFSDQRYMQAIWLTMLQLIEVLISKEKK